MDVDQYRLKEIQAKYLNLLVTSIGAIGVIISIIVGFNNQTDALENQWNQKFYEEKLDSTSEPLS